MDHPAIFAEQPFTGMLAAGPSQEQEFEILGESFSGEIGRGRSMPRGRAPTRRPPPRTATRRPPARPPRQMRAPKPPPRRPRRPRRPAPGGGYTLPFVAEPFGAPYPYPAPNADALRCMQECMGRGPAPASAPAPAPAEDTAAAPDAPADAAPDSPDSGADAGAPPAEEFELLEMEGGLPGIIGRIGSGIGQVIGRAGEALRDCKIIDLTAQSDRSVRKGTRDPKKVDALVLHQMACCFRRRDPMRSYLRIKSHFAILPEGQILQLHPITALIWASNDFNNRSVAVEFAGNFPNVQGRWWKGETYGRDRVTPAQLEAGRCLVRHLKRTMGLRVVLAHRQSSDTRENDPGPDVWYHVGQWAVDNLGLSDGGAGFKAGTGKPIPDAWRTWGRTGGAARPAKEFEFEFGEQEDEDAREDEQAYEDEGQNEYERGDEYEEESGDELWRGQPEGEVAPGLMTLAAAIADPRSAGSGIYTLYKNGQRLYVGRANQLRRRLQQHLWCLTHLKLGAGRFQVKLTPMRGATPAQLGRVEAAVIDRFGRQSRGGQLSNVKARELEQELWGEA